MQDRTLLKNDFIRNLSLLVIVVICYLTTASSSNSQQRLQHQRDISKLRVYKLSRGQPWQPAEETFAKGFQQRQYSLALQTATNRKHSSLGKRASIQNEPSNPTTSLHDREQINRQRPQDMPIQCTSIWTLNLTVSFRMNSSISAKQQGDLGLLDGAQTWFRFQGAAGTQLSNNCSQCAAFGNNGYWSNSSMPGEIAETKRILIYQGCIDALSNIYHGTVTRCQDEGLVYRLEDNMRIDGILCGRK